MAVKKIENKELLMCRGANVEELRCTGMKSIDEFSNSWSYLNVIDKKIKGKDCKFENVKKLPYCKNCNTALYQRYRDEKFTAEEALYYVCSMNNTPFIAEKVQQTFDFVTSEAKRGAKVSNIFGTYYNILLRETSKHHLWQDFSCTDIDYKDIATHIEKRDVTKKEMEQLELDWGKQSDIEDYALLDYWFDELTGDKPLEKVEELSYRDLCLARLSKRKIEQFNPELKTKDGESQDITKKQTQITSIQARINSLMKMLKIDNFEEKKQQTIIERMLETRINEQEKYKPAMFYEGKKENEDYFGRSKYFHDHIYRPIMNQFANNKLYDIVPKETDDLSDEEYEDKMLNKKFNESEE